MNIGKVGSLHSYISCCACFALFLFIREFFFPHTFYEKDVSFSVESFAIDKATKINVPLTEIM
jgi:hypothetical protein